jgi:hypothetical protein
VSGEGFKINPDELHSGADQLGQFSDHITTSLGKLRDTHQRLSTSASSDRSGVGQVLVKAATTSEKVMGDVAQEGARVAKGASDRLHTGAKSHTDNEEKQTGILKSISDKGEEGTTKPGSSSGGSGGKSGGGKSGGGGEPFSEPKGPSGEGAEPPLSGKKPPSASGEASTQFTEDPKLPKPSPYREPLPAADSDVRVPPADKTRGTKVEQLDEKRVTRGDDGLIKTVDGKPVKQYIGEKSAERAQGLSHNPATGQVAKKSKQAAEGRCSALAIDRRTGLVTQGVNGKATDVIPPDKLHPLLQQNLQDMRAYKHPVRGAVDKDGTPLVHDGKAHYSSPAGHAEVKASNELLWQRQAALKPGQELPASTLDDLRIDPRWTQPTGGAPIGGAAPACANCNSILDGVGSYTGRCTYDSHDGRYLNPAVPPVEE